MDKIAPYAKAFIASLVAGLGGLATSLDDGGVSWQESITVVITFLIAFGAVFSVPNRPQNE
jgi:hypothetical protein